MRTNIVLCVLNRIFPITDKATGEVRLPSDDTYYSPDLRRSFNGIQANEAPVKMLLKKAHEAGNDIDEIMYLCSNKCAEGIIPSESLAQTEGFPDTYNGLVSAEEFFFERIDSFCKKNEIKAPAFNPIPYNPSRPADCLPILNEYLNDSYEIYVDITGGRRDAVILQVLSMQLFKMQSRDNSIGDIVYSSFEDKTIVRQNPTFDLTDLINALDVFARYGRADLLNSFFNNRSFVSSETKELCRNMDSFSESMALCRMEGIEGIVQSIQESMDVLEETLTNKMHAYRLVSDALEALDDPDGWICSCSLEDALEKIKTAQIPIDLEGIDETTLRERLEASRWDYTIIRSELLLHSLIPLLRRRFIPKAESNAQLIINTIIWCVNHQMIQQALCIYREKISQALLDLGFFDATDHFKNMGVQEQREVVGDLCARCRVGKEKGRFKALYFPNSRDGEDGLSDYFSINESRYLSLLTIIGWYKYLHGIRNSMMHVDTARDNFDFIFGCTLLGKSPQDNLTVEDMKCDILSALKCIKHPIPADVNDWNTSYENATSTRNHFLGESDTKPAYSTSTPDEQYVSSIVELQMLLMKYAPGERYVCWTDFNAWCNQQGKQLNKKRLGLNPDKPFYAGLCEKHPTQFSHSISDGSVYLTFKRK